MGYELWEEFGGALPDVIIYPTGGGVGLIGMWKAFEELEAMGLIGRRAPADDFRPGCGLRAHRPSLRAASRQLRVLRQRRHARLRTARAETARRLPDPRRSLRERRRRGRRHRRGNDGRMPRNGRTRGHVRGTRRRRRARRDRKAGGAEQNSGRRNRRAVQHRQRLQVPRGLADALLECTERETRLENISSARRAAGISGRAAAAGVGARLSGPRERRPAGVDVVVVDLRAGQPRRHRISSARRSRHLQFHSGRQNSPVLLRRADFSAARREHPRRQRGPDGGWIGASRSSRSSAWARALDGRSWCGLPSRRC